jgi:hypothetical protein
MKLKYQRGELSLLWAAVIVGVIALMCMGALFSMRYERNFFAETWNRFAKSDAGKAIQQTQKAAEAVTRPDGAGTDIRKCVIDGKVVYSNVECDTKNASTRKVQLHDTQGVEAPKVPQASASQPEQQPTLQEKMIEKATR